jgi:hypothetical protein
LRRLRLTFGRHVTRVDSLDQLRPAMRLAAQFEITRERIDAQLTLLIVRSMTVDAVFCQEGFVRFRRVCGTGNANAGGEEQK